ncbi:MAG: helix-turn-helix domain-containing protein [Holosporales bacterium]|jgi:transcriptional regulator with XRE-family HTH domain
MQSNASGFNLSRGKYFIMHPIDHHVGQRLRLLRSMSGISQERLASDIGLTFQQIQKYERGANRISASKLYEIAQSLKVSISAFFAGYGTEAEAQDYSTSDTLDNGLVLHENQEDKDSLYNDEHPLSRKETLELVTAYWRIPDPSLRNKIFDIIKHLSAGTPGRKPLQ